MKVFYKHPEGYYEKIKHAAMRIMVISITNGIPLEDFYPATNEDKDFGLFCKTERGGKMFWTYNELEELYIRKNNEVKRFKR